MTRIRGAPLAWMAPAIALFLFVLTRLWFNAPVWDDYDAILDGVMRMRDAPSAAQWLGIVVAQHNEHRIAVVRLAAWALAAISDHVDFRMLVLAGDLSLVGLLVLAWAEFREAVAAPLFAGAAFLLLQWSYYEAALMGSASLANIGVVSFSFACLFFATREWRAAPACAALFGALAAGCQANGLFALPVAAGAALLAGRRRRAAALAGIAALLWVLYFLGYSRPPSHPSPWLAVAHPLDAGQLFLIVLGGMVPGRWLPILLGLALLAALAWLAARGGWRRHPAAWSWIAFVLLSAAAAAVGRVGFGVFHASRYGIYSACLVLVVFLLLCEGKARWSPLGAASVVAVAAAASLGASWASWPEAAKYALGGHLLAQGVPAGPGAASDRYFGMLHPNAAWSGRILRAAAKEGLYRPPRQPIYSTSLMPISTLPAPARLAGYLDDVQVEGNRLVASGWTDVLPLSPGRTMRIYSRSSAPASMRLDVVSRAGVALLFGEARLVYSGFRLAADYPSADEAKRAAASLCILAGGPGRSSAVLGRAGVSCPPRDGKEAQR